MAGAASPPVTPMSTPPATTPAPVAVHQLCPLYSAAFTYLAFAPGTLPTLGLASVYSLLPLHSTPPEPL